MNKEIDREKLYVGKVGLARNVIKYTDDAPFIIHETMTVGELYPLNWQEYRSSLFTLDDEGYSKDALYDVDNYPVLNISPEFNFDYIRADKGCYRPDELIIVKDAYNLDYLLRELGYPRFLSKEEVLMIRKNVFNTKFLKNNASRFGLIEKFPPSRVTGVSVVGEEVSEKTEYLKQRIEYLIKKIQGKSEYQIFTAEIYHDTLELRRYIEVINYMRDASLFEWLESHFEYKMDAFKPVRKELKRR